MTVTAGAVTVNGYRTRFEVHHTAEAEPRTPLLVLHGGPGHAHNALRPLRRLTQTGRDVVFYDQLGCGLSDRPDDPSLWTIELFDHELHAVRDHLVLDQVVLLGHSWGGMLALEHLLRGADGVRALVLASAPASVPLWIEETQRLRASLPPDVERVLREHEQAGTTDDPAYLEAVEVFYERHVCRVQPKPQDLIDSERATGRQVYETMVGASEITTTGVLRTWDIRDQLDRIDVPTLLTHGAHDEFTPRQAQLVADGIPGCRRVLLPASSHTAHLEETTAYLAVVADFLVEVGV
jgi:L-proline amide hydrolase